MVVPVCQEKTYVLLQGVRVLRRPVSNRGQAGEKVFLARRPRLVARLWILLALLGRHCTPVFPLAVILAGLFAFVFVWLRVRFKLRGRRRHGRGDVSYGVLLLLLVVLYALLVLMLTALRLKLSHLDVSAVLALAVAAVVPVLMDIPTSFGPLVGKKAVGHYSPY